MEKKIIFKNDVTALTQIKLGKDETMKVFWKELRPDTSEILAYAKSDDVIEIERFIASKTILCIKINDLCLFNVNYRIDVKAK